MINAFLPAIRLQNLLPFGVLLLTLGISTPAFAQLDGAYHHKPYVFLFTEGGLYQAYDQNTDGLKEAGSYTLNGNVLRVYNEDDNLTLQANLTKTRSGITISAQGESLSMRYLCSSEDFLVLALLGAWLSLLDE